MGSKPKEKENVSPSPLDPHPLYIGVAKGDPELKMTNKHERYMREALKEAVIAFEADEVPVGAVIVYKGAVIAKAHNQIKMLKDPTAHAEMIAITQATSFLKHERLKECDLYVTIEPCPMCAGAMVLARIRNLYYAAEDPKTGACGTLMNIVQDRRLNHRVKVTPGILREDSRSLIREFFKQKRPKKTDAHFVFADVHQLKTKN
jgi:tRNA(adenine34) deaminase